MVTRNLTYADAEGVKAIIAGEVTFYFTRLDDRSGLVRALESAIDAVSANSLWYRTESMSQSRKFTREVLQYPSAWFAAGVKLRREYELTLTSDPDKDLTQSWGVRFGVEPANLPDIAGFLQVNLPLTSPAQDAEVLRTLALSLADCLDYRSGHAGFGVQYDEGDIDDARDRAIGAWCKRYRCVDYRDFAASSEHMAGAIKGVGWLTFLDDGLADELGGVDALAANAGPEVEVSALRRGCVLQAGPVPLLGDVNARENIEAYRAAFALVEPVVVAEDLMLPGFDDDESVDWVRRFA